MLTIYFIFIFILNFDKLTSTEIHSGTRTTGLRHYQFLLRIFVGPCKYGNPFPQLARPFYELTCLQNCCEWVNAILIPTWPANNRHICCLHVALRPYKVGASLPAGQWAAASFTGVYVRWWWGACSPLLSREFFHWAEDVPAGKQLHLCACVLCICPLYIDLGITVLSCKD